MGKINKYLVIIILGMGVVIYYLTQNTRIVKVPEIHNVFKHGKVIYLTDTIEKTKYVTKWKTIEVKTQNPVNDSLALAYTKQSDSIQRFKMYLRSIEIKKFTSFFEDDFIKIEINGEVQGSVKYLQPTYTIKEREITLKNTFRLGLGASFIESKPFITGAAITNDFIFNYHLNLSNVKQVNLSAVYLF